MAKFNTLELFCVLRTLADKLWTRDECVERFTNVWLKPWIVLWRTLVERVKRLKNASDVFIARYKPVINIFRTFVSERSSNKMFLCIHKNMFRLQHLSARVKERVTSVSRNIMNALNALASEFQWLVLVHCRYHSVNFINHCQSAGTWMAP